MAAPWAGSLHSPLLDAHHSDSAPPTLLALHDELKARPTRDLIWARLYGLLLITCIGMGVYTVMATDQVYGVLTQRSDYLDDSSHCPSNTLDSMDVSQAALLLSKGGSAAQVKGLVWSGAVIVAAALGLAAALSFAFILLLQHYPGVLVFITVAMQVAIPAVWGLVALQAGHTTLGLLALGLAAVLAWSFWYWRSGLELVASMLGLSARALRDQPGLLVLALGLNLLLPLLWAAFSAATVAVAASGSVLPNPSRASVTAGGVCLSHKGEHVSCCVWQPVPWASVYTSLASGMLLWTTLLLNQIKVFTVSGAMCQWYWAPPSSSLALSGSRGPRGVVGATHRSLGQALGPSLGSLCLGSLILFFTSWFTFWLSHWRKARVTERGLLVTVLHCLLGCLVTLVEQLSKFAVVRCAMTGEAFLQASRDVVGLLWRNHMDAYSVWWYPPLVLRLTSGLLAASLSYGAYKITLLVWAGRDDMAGVDVKAAAGLLAAITGAASFVMMAFLSSLLLNVLDALWVCFAEDREHKCCCRPAVHQVFSQLPAASGGALVVQPGGEYGYAEPTWQPGHPHHPQYQQYQQGPYPPPQQQQYPYQQPYQQPYQHQYQQPYQHQPYQPGGAVPSAPYPPVETAGGAWQPPPHATDPRYPNVK